MLQTRLLTLLLFFLFASSSFAQMGDPEYLANAEHALLNYQNCEVTNGNLRKISAAGRSLPLYLLLKAKHAELCLKNADSAIFYYRKYLNINPSDQQTATVLNALIQQKFSEEKKKDCHWCKGSGYYDSPEKCSQCNGTRNTGTASCTKCEGTGKRDCTFCVGGINHCNLCSGTGYNSYNYLCNGCSGRGSFYCTICNGVGTRGNCAYCWGKGKKEVRCARCEGVGYNNVRKKCTSHP